MKYILLILIKIYQSFVPKRLRSKCLYKESCSNYVFRLTKENGFFAGIGALKYRINNCNPQYFIVKDKGDILLITAQNEIIEEEFISKNVMKEILHENYC